MYLCLLQELRQLLETQSAASSAALSQERVEAARRAGDSAAAAVEAAQQAAASALHSAEVKVALLEGQLEVMEQERDMLQEQVCGISTRCYEQVKGRCLRVQRSVHCVVNMNFHVMSGVA